MNLGVIFHPSYPPETLIDFARRAEAGGFDELWLWEDSFWAGAFSSAAVALGATQRLRVGIGLMPAVGRNPLFSAMELTLLERLYPGRLLPGYGHGVEAWMKQIGAAPRSFLKALEETIRVIRALLRGEEVTFHGDHVQFDAVKMLLTAPQIPPLLVGAMREKTLQLAGRVGDGTILTDPAEATYVRWSREHIARGMAEAGRSDSAHHVVVYVLCKVGDEAAARQSARIALASRIRWAEPQLKVIHLWDEAKALVARYGDEVAAHIPESWIDLLTACGTPERAATMIRSLADAGATSVVLQPMDGDPACLDEYIRDVVPLIKRG